MPPKSKILYYNSTYLYIFLHEFIYLQNFLFQENLMKINFFNILLIFFLQIEYNNISRSNSAMSWNTLKLRRHLDLKDGQVDYK